MPTHIDTVWHYNADSLLQQPENNELPHQKPSVMAISGQNHGDVGKDGLRRAGDIQHRSGQSVHRHGLHRPSRHRRLDRLLQHRETAHGAGRANPGRGLPGRDACGNVDKPPGCPTNRGHLILGHQSGPPDWQNEQNQGRRPWLVTPYRRASTAQGARPWSLKESATGAASGIGGSPVIA